MKHGTEAVELIIRLLKEKGALSTWELKKELKTRAGECPDELVRLLMKMKKDGIIKGEISKEKKGWVWLL